MNTKYEELTTVRLFSTLHEHTLAHEYLAEFDYPWQALDGLGEMIRRIGASLSPDEYDRRGEDIWISKTAVIAPTAELNGPCIIGHNSDVRHCALIRGNVLIGNEVNVGHCTGLKNCILFDGVQVPHYNYVGDSILGYKSHLGAQALTSNLKSDKTNVTVRVGNDKLDTGRQKCGSMLGDYVEIGAGCVLNPGTVIGEHSNVYPLTSVRGYIPPRHIVKAQNTVVPKQER